MQISNSDIDESKKSIPANQYVPSGDLVDESNESIPANPNLLFNRDNLGTHTVAVERESETFGPTPNFILIPESQDEDFLCPVNDIGTDSLAVHKEDNILDVSTSNVGVPVDSSSPTSVCEVQPAVASLNTDKEDNIIGVHVDSSPPNGLCEVQPADASLPNNTIQKDKSDIPSAQCGPLPRRLFATDRYPVKGRINSYSKPEYLLDIVDVLDGSTQLKWLKDSCFGRLFKLPARKSSLSGKLVHQFLCRSLITRKKHEMCFVYGGHPIRFSLREFGILTGLNCGPLPSDEDESTATDVAPISDSDFFHTLIGPNNSYTIREIVDILKADKKLPNARRMNGDRRLRLCLVVIVDGILICFRLSIRLSIRLCLVVIVLL